WCSCRSECSLLTPCSLDYRLRSVGQACCRNNVEAAVGQFLRAQLGIVAFQTNHHGHLDAHVGHRGNDTVGDQVTAHDTAEDIHQYGFDVAVGENDLEGDRKSVV